jgi:hypothetical protein
MPEKVQYPIKVQLGSTINVDWKAFAGDKSLVNKVIKVPVLIKIESKKCEKSGNIPASQVAGLLFGMLGTPEMTDELLDRNIYLPLIEMNIVQYGESKW